MKAIEKIHSVCMGSYPGHYDAAIYYRGKILHGTITDMRLIDAWKEKDTGPRKTATLAKRIYDIVRGQYTYYVRNVYGIAGAVSHSSFKSALKDRHSREGEGWVIEDGEGRRIASHDGQPVVVH